MTFIKRVSDSISIFTTPEPQMPETSQSQPATNFGIANNTDLFEANDSNNFDFMQPQPQDLSLIQPSTSAEITVDASSLFKYLNPDSPQPTSRLQDLQDRLKSINEKIREIKDSGALRKAKEESIKLQQMASEIRGAANDDKALSSSIIATLGGLGILGIIGGFPAPRIIAGLLGGLGIFGGLSEEYKQKMLKAAAELEKKAGEQDLELTQLQREFEELNKLAESVEELIKEEEHRLKLGFSEQEFKPSLMTAESPFEEFLPDQTFVQTDNTPSAVPLSPDIQKLTNEE